MTMAMMSLQAFDVFSAVPCMQTSCGVVWFGVVWCGVEWYSVMWYSVVQFDEVWCRKEVEKKSERGGREM